METIITTDHIRHVAESNPGSWVVNQSETGYVCVTCFYLPVENEYFKSRTNGLRIEIERFPKGDYLLNGYYVEPTRERKQTIRIKRENSYDAALAAGQDFVKEILESESQTLIKYYPALYGQVEEQIEMAF